jgi:DNA repair photolyase
VGQVAAPARPGPSEGTQPPPSPLRWRLASDDARGALFSTEAFVERHVGVGAYRSMEFLHVNARRLINEVPAASRMPFRHTINAYRGCSHACVYCFARPTHTYLGLNAGQDFERRIVVKVNAVERAEAEVRSRGWRGEHIAMGTNTDPYQKAEAKYHLTRGIVEVLGRHRNSFSILTKSTLVLRDLDVLRAAAARTSVRVAFSVATLDRDVWRLTEPGTPPPEKRLDAVRTLNEAGIPCSVLIAPVLPGLSDRDDQLVRVAQACVAAGAVSITPIALHLRPGVRDLYLDWLGTARPDLLAGTRARFGGRAYQPDEEQQRIRRVVEAAIERLRAAGVPPRFARAPWRAARWATGHEDHGRADGGDRTPTARGVVPGEDAEDAAAGGAVRVGARDLGHQLHLF